ncbi:NADH dehydrogenase [Parafrankia colletiae]|uniref:NADH dehydrogenase n=1 Tax=Parafrankia colletiae TaxID=573497 RepID=A0A1S1RGQ0_9ACTN|nr:nitroreductase family protein [Parafrankia colletiae]MCK9903185.1 nitroreductase family protein [Frankia sp. Cpl3]OHV44979.1 NADH dehydrogenase [Parafrankia colletiae]
MLDLSADELLSTTRAVRHRLDFSRPVPWRLIEECVDLAVQAPTGRNRQRWHFVVVTDARRRAALADVFRRAVAVVDPGVSRLSHRDVQRMTMHSRSMTQMVSGFQHLYDNIHRVPAIVVPCVEGRTDGASALAQSMTWGSILPAVWSFMLAARARGLGTVWTTAQGPLEREMAQVLGVPYDEVMLAAFIPLAFTLGTEFRPAPRVPRDQILHRDRW